MIISHWIPVGLKNDTDESYSEKWNTLCMLRNIFSPRKSYRLWDNVEKYCTAKQTTDDNISWMHISW